MADIHLTDPLGRTIVLRDRTWFGHIVKSHDDMASRHEQVESLIRSPFQIRICTKDPAV